MLTPKYNIVSFLVLLCTLLSLRTFGQLDSEHYLPPLKQVSNNAAIQQQAIYFSTPETTPFNIKIFRGSNTTEIVTITGPPLPSAASRQRGECVPTESAYGCLWAALIARSLHPQ